MLEGKVAIVTGGGKGIGKGCAIALAEKGCDVAVNAFHEESAMAVVNEIKNLGRRSISVAADVFDLDKVNNMVKKMLNEFKKVDILVSNVGFEARLGRYFVETNEEDWKLEINGNLLSAIYVTRAVLDHMIERKYGRIIYISSDAGRVGEKKMAVYSAAKAGVNTFAKSLAKEVGRYGITVNTVTPGTIKTPGSMNFITKVGEERLAKAYPLGRIGVPEDVGGLVAFLASDEASWISGQTISVSGGYTTLG